MENTEQNSEESKESIIKTLINVINEDATKVMSYHECGTITIHEVGKEKDTLIRYTPEVVDLLYKTMYDHRDHNPMAVNQPEDQNIHSGTTFADKWKSEMGEPIETTIDNIQKQTEKHWFEEYNFKEVTFKEIQSKLNNFDPFIVYNAVHYKNALRDISSILYARNDKSMNNGEFIDAIVELMGNRENNIWLWFALKERAKGMSWKKIKILWDARIGRTAEDDS